MRITMEISRVIWDVLLWGFGLCATGFFLLAGWMWWLVGKVRIKESMVEKMSEISGTLKSIESALVGDFDKKGLITRVNEIEKTCGRNHGER